MILSKSNLKPVDNHVLGLVCDKLWDQVNDQVCNQLWNQVSNKINDPVINQVYYQLLVHVLAEI